MNIYTPALHTKACIGTAAAVVCAILSGPIQAGAIQAEERIVSVHTSVRAAGLDLNQPADARELYRRLDKAARALCGDSLQVDLRNLTDFASCYERTLGGAVRSANRQQLTMIYLRTHTLQEAANRGIAPPAMLVAK
jgi:UrcA family protein